MLACMTEEPTLFPHSFLLLFSSYISQLPEESTSLYLSFMTLPGAPPLSWRHCSIYGNTLHTTRSMGILYEENISSTYYEVDLNQLRRSCSCPFLAKTNSPTASRKSLVTFHRNFYIIIPLRPSSKMSGCVRVRAPT
jgi:hypothetical protein